MVASLFFTWQARAWGRMGAALRLGACSCQWGSARTLVSNLNPATGVLGGAAAMSGQVHNLPPFQGA